EQHVHFARRWLIGDFARQIDEFISGIAAGADDDNDLIPRVFRPNRPPRGAENSFRGGDACATEFLYHQSQGRVLLSLNEPAAKPVSVIGKRRWFSNRGVGRL